MAFVPMPGVIFFAFSTVFVEIGTAAYCAWVLWRCRRLYLWVMNASNLVPLIGCSMCIYRAGSECPLELIIGYVGFVALVIGRTWFLMAELRQHKEGEDRQSEDKERRYQRLKMETGRAVSRTTSSSLRAACQTDGLLTKAPVPNNGAKLE